MREYLTCSSNIITIRSNCEYRFFVHVFLQFVAY